MKQIKSNASLHHRILLVPQPKGYNGLLFLSPWEMSQHGNLWHSEHCRCSHLLDILASQIGAKTPWLGFFLWGSKMKRSVGHTRLWRLPGPSSLSLPKLILLAEWFGTTSLLHYQWFEMPSLLFRIIALSLLTLLMGLKWDPGRHLPHSVRVPWNLHPDFLSQFRNSEKFRGWGTAAVNVDLLMVTVKGWWVWCLGL